MLERWRRRCSICSKRRERLRFCLPVIWTWSDILRENSSFGVAEVKRFDTEGKGGKAEENLRKIEAFTAEAQSTQRKKERSFATLRMTMLVADRQSGDWRSQERRGAGLVRVDPADYFAE